MRWVLVLFPSILGISLLGFNNESLDESVPVFVLQFTILSVLSVLTVSWISSLTRSPLMNWVYVFLGVGNFILALYSFFKFWDGYISLPFFLLSSWCFLRVKF